MKKIYLSVVIPAYNEKINIKRGALSSVHDYLDKQKYSWEAIIVDDGSTDETAKLTENFARKHAHFRVLKEPHRGKGGTIIAGMLAAKGEIVLFTDMDQSTPIDQIEKFLAIFRKDYDVVIGSRKGREGASLIRKAMAYGFSFLRSIILRLPYKDTQCGFKAFRREAARDIFRKMKIFNKEMKTKGASVTAGFDLEVLYLARKLGLKVAEVPVEWREYGERREVSAIKDSWEGLRDLMKLRINDLMGKYKTQ
jgi:dolichyl-phosphate beta-glucosyltransferase